MSLLRSNPTHRETHLPIECKNKTPPPNSVTIQLLAWVTVHLLVANNELIESIPFKKPLTLTLVVCHTNLRLVEYQPT